VLPRVTSVKVAFVSFVKFSRSSATRRFGRAKPQSGTRFERPKDSPLPGLERRVEAPRALEVERMVRLRLRSDVVDRLR
jgi:hypothetical protein